jgi:transcriptional regulator with XRE-family HTH domain
MKKSLPSIARALQDARKAAGISQAELAKLSGVARITISGIEAGRHPSIRSSTAEKLAHSLGLTPGELLQAGQSAASEEKMEDVDALLRAYRLLKQGTVMVPSASEERWLRKQLTQWADDRTPTETSLLFLLLAHRHAAPKNHE